MKEWEVICDWCSAKEGEPCRDNHGVVLPDGVIHIPRGRLYDEKRGLNFKDRPYPHWKHLPSQFRIEQESL